MATVAYHSKAVQAALATDDDNAVWGAYTAAWGDNKTIPMTADTFRRIFSAPDVASAAVKLALKSKYAQETINGAAREYAGSLDSHDSDIATVMCAVLEPEDLVAEWRSSRSGKPANARSTFTGVFITTVIEWKGRAWVRERVLSWWNASDLLEEEREAIVNALERGGVLTETLLLSLGPIAKRYATLPDPMQGIPVPIASAPTELAAAIGSLLGLVRLPADLRDAALRAEETERCRLHVNPAPALFLRALQVRRRKSRMLYELEQALRDLNVPMSALVMPSQGPESSTFGVPLIRLLHMRLVLEAPALGGALARPEDHLTPEVLLYVLGQDAVTYTPELRLHIGMERRWRARWAEMCGEALSALWLEDTLQLDLTSLARIREERDRETPDFRAVTRAGEPIVFESKGATEFTTHKKQRRKALAQLGKLEALPNPVGSRKHRLRRSTVIWREPRRAFACCFYAASQGAESSSALHIADPPFEFDHVFPEGWEVDARRSHYAAVAEAAGLYDLADSLLGRGTTRDAAAEGEVFVLQSGGEQASRFRGTSTPLHVAARRLRHPRPDLFQRARMFVGILEQRFDDLKSGTTPGPLDTKEDSVVVGVGALPGREGGENVRGVYSILSDGSFLAFEVL